MRKGAGLPAFRRNALADGCAREANRPWMCGSDGGRLRHPFRRCGTICDTRIARCPGAA